MVELENELLELKQLRARLGLKIGGWFAQPVRVRRKPSRKPSRVEQPFQKRQDDRGFKPRFN